MLEDAVAAPFEVAAAATLSRCPIAAAEPLAEPFVAAAQHTLHAASHDGHSTMRAALATWTLLRLLQLDLMRTS